MYNSLKEWQESEKLQNREAANLCGLKTPTYEKIKYGYREGSFTNITKICKATGLDADAVNYAYRQKRDAKINEVKEETWPKNIT